MKNLKYHLYYTIKSIMPRRFRLGIEYLKMRVVGEKEIALLKQYKKLNEGRLAIDIGANRGSYSFAMSHHWEHVVSFEPNPALAQELETLSGASGRSIHVENCALGASSGIGSLAIPVVGGREVDGEAKLMQGDDSDNMRVSIKTLDSFELRDICFIKIDVEGAEYEVLEGGLDTIKRNKPIIQVEIEQRHQDRPVKEVIDFVEGLGYFGYKYDSKKCQFIKASSISTESLSNNFIFFPGHIQP